MKKLGVSFIFTIIVLVIIIALLVTNEDDDFKKFGFEIAKLSTQLILIVIFGGILVQEFNRKREKKQALNDFRKTILRDLIRAYADAKKARRLLRAKCTAKADGENNTGAEIPYAVYEQQLHNVNDVQLRLEILIHEIDTFKQAFTDADELKLELGRMEKYLNRLVSEYEKISPTNNQLECLSLSRLDQLSQFIHHGSESEPSRFRKMFTPAFLKSLELIRAESLKL